MEKAYLLLWEEIPHNNGFYLRRTPIFGGWLVQMVSDVNIPEMDTQWRTTVTFVPDIWHEWDLNKIYKANEKFGYPNSDNNSNRLQ